MPPIRSSPVEEIGIGIDLGTTFSAVAILDETGTPQIVPTSQGDRTVPSVVAFDQSSSPVVGKEALHMIGAYRHVKRVIGTGGKLDPAIAALVPHVVPNPQGKTYKKDSLTNQLHDAEHHPTLLQSTREPASQIRPEYISSCILQSLKSQVEQQTGKVVTRAVIGVPAYFNDAQRQATKEAATLAGIDKVKLLREPEAAALAYGKLLTANSDLESTAKDDDEDELVLVMDLGGGTYDVSVLIVSGDMTEIVCTSGNVQLGGADMDRRIGNHLMECIRREARSNDSKKWSEEAVTSVMKASEKIRIFLSNKRSVNLALPLSETQWIGLQDPSCVIQPDLSQTGKDDTISNEIINNSTHLLYQLSRKKMESLCQEELMSLLRPLREVAIAGGALLPGDADPAVVQMTLNLEETSQQEFPEFYSEESLSDADNLMRQMKQAKKAQQMGRRKAHKVAKGQRKFRAEKSRLQQSNRKVQTGIHGRPISRVVLVGGTTRMPVIGRLIAAVTGVVPQRTVNPDEAVALGCAVHVGVLDGDEGAGTVLNPMQAALIRALAKQKGMMEGQLSAFDDEDFDFEDGEVEYVTL